MLKKLARLALGLLILLAIPGIPAAYSSWKLTAWRNFHVVAEGRLYRSGQLSRPVLHRLIHDHQIRTVICLRARARTGDTVVEDGEERWCLERGIRCVRIDPATWDTPEAERNVAAFRRVVEDPEAGPILIHCFAGSHRTGVYCAIYRMAYEGWSPERAIAEMADLGGNDALATTYVHQFGHRLHR